MVDYTASEITDDGIAYDVVIDCGGNRPLRLLRLLRLARIGCNAIFAAQDKAVGK